MMPANKGSDLGPLGPQIPLFVLRIANSKDGTCGYSPDHSKKMSHLRIDSFHSPLRELNYGHKVDGDTS
jgi:hypothetical protein